MNKPEDTLPEVTQEPVIELEDTHTHKTVSCKECGVMFVDCGCEGVEKVSEVYLCDKCLGE